MSVEQESAPEWGRFVIAPQVSSPRKEQDDVQEPFIVLSAAFIEQMRHDGLPVEEIIQDIQTLKPGEALQQLRRETGYSKRVIRRALRNEDQSPLPEPVMRTLDWFKKQRRRHWILGETERLFAEDLVEFSEGKPTDFLIWNCLEFKWEQEPSRGYPPCRISSNLDTSLVLYHRERLEEATSRLSSIGRPNITVLVPSSEATYEDMWNYRQPREEREAIVNETVAALNARLESTTLSKIATIRAQRWDDYLKSQGLAKEPLEYSREGEQRLWRSPDIDRMVNEAVENGVEYFGRFDIEVDPEKIEAKRIRYYGMYEGEGAAMRDIRDRGTGVVVLNFEEFRVSRLAFRGADKKLPILTPVTDEEMNTYYRWESEQGKNLSSFMNK
jgi:hypothetical protein